MQPPRHFEKTISATYPFQRLTLKQAHVLQPSLSSVFDSLICPGKRNPSSIHSIPLCHSVKHTFSTIHCLPSYDSVDWKRSTHSITYYSWCVLIYDSVGLFCSMTRGMSVGDWMIGRKGGNSSVLSHRGGGASSALIPPYSSCSYSPVPLSSASS